MSSPGSALKLSSPRELLLQFEELRSKLEEAEATLDAIRTGEVDALIVQGKNGQQVYTLKGANDNYRIFVERMQEGAVTLDGDGIVLYCNQRMADMTTRNLETVIGSPFAELLDEDERRAFMDRLQGAGNEPDRYESAIGCDSTSTPVVISIFRLDEDGPASFALTVTDLSDQKRHEQELRKANTELEGFCHSISHDLRAPLRSIVSAASIVIEDYGGQLPEPAQEDLKRIKAAGNYLGLLIDDLLMYARLSRHTLKREKVNVAAMAQNLVSQLEYADKVEWKIEPTGEAVGDPRLVEIVLQNLMSNAVKYSAAREHPRIEIGQQEFDEGPAFYVKDNGIGFNMSYVNKIFVPFERLHTNDQYPGTGIGLANVQRILTRHGGRIWAEAEVDKGATFYFTIPNHAMAATDVPV